MKRIIGRLTGIGRGEIQKNFKMTLDERQEWFIQQVATYVEYDKEMLHEFCEYWTEHNDNARKMKFEFQKVFQIKKRLVTWHKNSKKFYGRPNQTTERFSSTKLGEAHSKVFGGVES